MADELRLQELGEGSTHRGSIGDNPVLISSAASSEVLVRRPSGKKETTMVFMHETIAMMKAERAERIEKIRSVLAPDSMVVPIRKKNESFWDHITVGRADLADIILPDPAISNIHAHFEVDARDAKTAVKDVGSSNGTFVNRERLQPHVACELRAGDCVRFGQSIFYYLSSSMFWELVA